MMATGSAISPAVNCRGFAGNRTDEGMAVHPAMALSALERPFSRPRNIRMTGSDQKRFYVTTPIYYVNDKPHIGHAYTTLACDVLARFKRLDGFEVMFLTGTDEHGQKVEKAATDKGVTPQAFTDSVSENFRELTARMNFSNDDFIRTTEAQHRAACQKSVDPARTRPSPGKLCRMVRRQGRGLLHRNRNRRRRGADRRRGMG